MNLNESNYKPYVDTTYKYFLRNKDGDGKLDNMLDKIDRYDFHPGIEYYRIDDYDFELYRYRRKLIKSIESGFSDSSIEDILNRKVNENKTNEEN